MLFRGSIRLPASVDHAIVVRSDPQELLAYAMFAVEHQTDALDVTDGRSPSLVIGVGPQGHRAGLDHSAMRYDERCSVRRQTLGDEPQYVGLLAREVTGGSVAEKGGRRIPEVDRPAILGQHGGIECGEALDLRGDGEAHSYGRLEGAGYGAGYHEVVTGHRTELSVSGAARKVYARPG